VGVNGGAGVGLGRRQLSAQLRPLPGSGGHDLRSSLLFDSRERGGQRRRHTEFLLTSTSSSSTTPLPIAVSAVEEEDEDDATV
jgi:hypothetical protein